MPKRAVRRKISLHPHSRRLNSPSLHMTNLWPPSVRRGMRQNATFLQGRLMTIGTLCNGPVIYCLDFNASDVHWPTPEQLGLEARSKNFSSFTYIRHRFTASKRSTALARFILGQPPWRKEPPSEYWWMMIDGPRLFRITTHLGLLYWITARWMKLYSIEGFARFKAVRMR